MIVAARGVYIDANVLVYIVEATEPFRSHLEQFVEAIDAGRVRCVTSEITVAEVMFKPIEADDPKTIEHYARVFSPRSPLQLSPVHRAIIDRSVKLCAGGGLKLVDAIHVATAEATNCSHFLTADQRIRLPESIQALAPDQVTSFVASQQASK